MHQVNCILQDMVEAYKEPQKDIQTLIKESQAKIARTCQLIEKSIHRIEGTQYVIAVSGVLINQEK